MKIVSYDLAPFEMLVTLILKQATELEILNSLNDLIDKLEAKMVATDTELKNIAAKPMFRRVLESREVIPRTMECLKNAMRRELNGSIFFNTIGFRKNYSQNLRLDKKRDSITKTFLECSLEL
ncbi:Bgt-50891 [Blumeria graminis f. sp. tritici]|uniref:Bgt-50891 n=1 Tax=Blumeria graminis f. sp. tritici TaxID=62690 RepID=A0A9X9QEI9_BLUGR|nr:Bgt-50891 [Blumeria graminis f. sp. tritici]